LLGLEKKYTASIQVENNNAKLAIQIGGIIDRIDLVDGRVRIVDYKTGRSDNRIANISSLVHAKQRNKAAFQTMLYAWCVQQTEKRNEVIVPAVYGARSVFQADFQPYFKMDDKDLVLHGNANEFIQLIQTVFSEILDTEIPFSQTTDKAKCSTCPYNTICLR
jgi:CRISPR/Cas system-associated exonuclease Cas4 (RecB family)